MSCVKLFIPASAALAGNLHQDYTRKLGPRQSVRTLESLTVEFLSPCHRKSYGGYYNSAPGQFLWEQTMMSVWFTVSPTRKNGHPETVWVTRTANCDLFDPQFGVVDEDGEKELAQTRKDVMFLASAALQWLFAYATYLSSTGDGPTRVMGFSNIMLADTTPLIDLDVLEHSVCQALTRKFVQYCGACRIPVSVIFDRYPPCGDRADDCKQTGG